ncbi:NADPH-dependent 2,4-dienoyl-CoA reductase, sulfur reductase [Streptoalloteichus tenebrarius]|uniref:NADPH-dependent 2,4-dienoyl-CoA reductase, sulfur reductase n=1 Tax=Streptoalloteichus tenebrarius (strain ATCC 17920 / DSM 40477 / JCM 4838 / CBS 697.72 / NBRC 16177 / NCIMB 11028 / NRRL B-12390 / A12253. 1 / ISP 5477) TaxID=1933 RepID=A0ABT1HLW5_STRSD|nr:FAD/NAD(P)-binding oxidoreductase [Streptoalloteichus tenebrarius]MCP2256479.1 NADPH-dependent 2,4-dienoyl-CoA reductase, sulfur reductase [Streptoalloteichus tenebrarius]BFF04832.1 FAD-dependent oxidoreductase [Streptoalloteichus tenebrarius]
MSAPGHVLVVGASVGGLTTAESLRRRGFTGRLTLLDAEPRQPYDRPPLSKQVLAGVWPPERVPLRQPETLSALDAEFLLGDPAAGLDVAERTVHTVGGRVLTADVVVVATGLRPRTLPGQAGLAGVHVLRTLDDAMALRADLLRCARLVVVGDGVLGAEIAASARGMGVEVTMVGPQPAPLTSRFGPLVAGVLAELHTERGVDLRPGAAVTGLTERHGRVTGVCLEGGEVLPADVVVVALGGEPVTDWLAHSGLDVDDGLICDSRCRAAEGIYAVGDVARWHHEALGVAVRWENRTNAVEQAVAVAGDILGDDQPYTPVSYFWTDQFDARIHVHGETSPTAEVSIVEGDVAERRFVAAHRRDGGVIGVVGWNMPKQARLRRRELVGASVLVGGKS